MTASTPSTPDAPGAVEDGIALGTVIEGRYRLEAVLGSGGMGRVYRGEHLGIGRPVAIKVLHADMNRNRDAAARFQREAIASGRLDHPNIVNVSDFGVLEDGAPYMVMEVLDGEPLGDRLQRDKHVAWREALEIMRGVLCGLAHAHERGVVHRDIKPDNVYLTRKDGELIVKILDFGIAKLYAGNADDPASTRTGLTVGTPAYLSPEQAVGGEITPASDLYSATVMLFEMLAGRAPFEDKDPLAMLGAHVSRPPPFVGDIAPGIELPYGLEEIIQAGLAKSAADRIKSANDYLLCVDAVLTAPPGAASAELARELLGLIPAARPTPPPARAAGKGAVDPLANVSDRSILLAVDQLAAVPSRAVDPLANVSDQSILLAVDQLAPVAHAAYTPMPPMQPAPAPEPATPRRLPPPPSINDQSVMITVEPYRPPGPPDPSGSPASSRSSASPPGSPGLPPQARVVSLTELGPPLPRRWLVGGAIVLGVCIAVAIAGVLSGGSSTPAHAPAPAVARPVLIDVETQVKALLHDLQNGKTCEERRATIAKLVAFRDPRVIDALRKARYRMQGGVLGIGSTNANACLTKDANAALKALGAGK